MQIGTVYGVTKEGDARHIKTAEVTEVLKIWKNRNPPQFVKIGYFTLGGAKRLRNVDKARHDATKAKSAK